MCPTSRMDSEIWKGWLVGSGECASWGKSQQASPFGKQAKILEVSTHALQWAAVVQDRMRKWSSHPTQPSEMFDSTVPIPWVWELLISMASAQQQVWAGTRWAVPDKWPKQLPSPPYPSPEQVSDSQNFNGLWYSQPYNPRSGWSFYQMHSSPRGLERASLV